jgi:hypothetical protein
MYLTLPSVKFGRFKLQYFGGSVVVVVFGSADIGVTPFCLFGAGVVLGGLGLLGVLVVRAGGFGAVHAGVPRSLIGGEVGGGVGRVLGVTFLGLGVTVVVLFIGFLVVVSGFGGGLVFRGVYRVRGVVRGVLGD